MEPYASSAVYTILAKSTLDDHAARGRVVKGRESKRWVRAKEVFDGAKALGQEMIALFADAAEDCSNLMYCGTLKSLRVADDGTSFEVRNLTRIVGHTTQDLVLESTGKNIAPGYIRPYAMVRAPAFARPRTTLFSFGYAGTGSATRELAAAINAGEQRRGYGPPLWVDIRVNRSVRAAGFRDRAFEELLGEQYVWLRDLGNQRVADGTEGIEIRRPEAVHELLDLALANPDRRVIFFCSCEHPAGCHRREVARLALAAARKRGLAVSVVEWPGGQPIETTVDVSAAVLKKLRGSLKRLPLPASMDVADAVILPWGSQLNVGRDQQKLAVGSARLEAAGTFLTIIGSEDDPTGRRWCKSHGYLG